MIPRPPRPLIKRNTSFDLGNSSCQTGRVSLSNGSWTQLPGRPGSPTRSLKRVVPRPASRPSFAFGARPKLLLLARSDQSDKGFPWWGSRRHQIWVVSHQLTFHLSGDMERPAMSGGGRQHAGAAGAAQPGRAFRLKASFREGRQKQKAAVHVHRHDPCHVESECLEREREENLQARKWMLDMILITGQP